MTHVEAIFRHGVFEPLEPVDLPEDQRVVLSFEAASTERAREWLEEVRRLQAPIIERQGFLPDSAPDIAADRRR
ncbi:MAG: antitoxin family protein [Planctomycetia bacterium]|nr:antitoxin family protein [Planctomycetia bacterium]